MIIQDLEIIKYYCNNLWNLCLAILKFNITIIMLYFVNS